MEEQLVTIRTVLLGGLTGTAEINATAEVAAFVNPDGLTLAPNVTEVLAEVQRIGNPPIQTIILVLRNV